MVSLLIKINHYMELNILLIDIFRLKVHQVLESAAIRRIQFAVAADVHHTTFRSQDALNADIHLLRPVHVSHLEKFFFSYPSSNVRDVWKKIN